MSELVSLRRSAEQRLRRLSLERLRVVDDFLSYLEEREAYEATAELLALPGFTERLARAEKQADEGKVVHFDDIRREG